LVSFTPGAEEDNGDYFEIGPDGKLRLKAGKKKIDISKLTAEQLKALGIDLKNMSKEEIARILKVCGTFFKATHTLSPDLLMKKIRMAKRIKKHLIISVGSS
jgi:hypothetical protein